MPRFRTQDPLMLVPDGSNIRVFNVAQFLPRNPPPFPSEKAADDDDDDDDDEVDQLREAMSRETTRHPDEDPDTLPPDVYRRERPEKKLFEEVQGWIAEGSRAEGIRSQVTTLPDVEKCVLAFDGQVLLGVGKRGTLYSWKLTMQS